MSPEGQMAGQLGGTGPPGDRSRGAGRDCTDPRGKGQGPVGKGQPGRWCYRGSCYNQSNSNKTLIIFLKLASTDKNERKHIKGVGNSKGRVFPTGVVAR